MEPLWKECILWLDKFKVIPPGHPSLSGSSAGPHDLVLLLRDGVVLCQLVHCLDPQSVDMTQVLHCIVIIVWCPNVALLSLLGSLFISGSRVCLRFCVSQQYFPLIFHSFLEPAVEASSARSYWIGCVMLSRSLPAADPPMVNTVPSFVCAG